MTKELCIVKTVTMPTVHKFLSMLRKKLNGSEMPPHYLKSSQRNGVRAKDCLKRKEDTRISLP